VPRDLSVCSITDIQLASEVRPALTTVAVPTAEAAELAVAALMHMIDDRGTGANSTASIATASAPRLIVRGSSARPAAAAAG
jgi:DNA-binding LacI/PurR family transcriptional regulator